MSSYYEVVFSLFLRDDVPQDVLDELRWHLRLTARDRKPRAAVLGGELPVLCRGHKSLGGKS